MCLVLSDIHKLNNDRLCVLGDIYIILDLELLVKIPQENILVDGGSDLSHTGGIRDDNEHARD